MENNWLQRPWHLKRSTKIILLLSCASLLVVFLLGFYLYTTPSASDFILQTISSLRGSMESILSHIHPALYFIAFALLSSIGFPMTLFYLTTIPVFGSETPWLGIGAAWLAVGCNLVLSYWLVRSVLRPLALRFVEKRGYSIPAIQPETEITWILTLRLSPLPFFAQSMVLALGNCGFRKYMLISWPLQAVMGLGVMLVGDSIFSGGLRYALLGLFLIALAMLTFQLLKSRLRHDRSTSRLQDPLRSPANEND